VKPATLRLDRLLANLGYGSRREVGQMIAAGLVTGDHGRLRDPGERLVITADLPQRLRVGGVPLDPPPPLTLILHKPLAVVCSHSEPGRSVYELLPRRWRRRDPVLSTIGRLDADTSGLLLITDDGALLHRVISPRHHVTKRYLATLSRPLQGHEGATFAAGELVLEGEAAPLAPAVLEPLSLTTAYLTVTEGRYHQVRRMFAAVGNHVVALHRDQVGGLELPGALAPGAFQIASPHHLDAVFRTPATPPAISGAESRTFD
jgi:16S rRNA pseudouridine516 synthase